MDITLKLNCLCHTLMCHPLMRIILILGPLHVCFSVFFYFIDSRFYYIPVPSKITFTFLFLARLGPYEYILCKLVETDMFDE